MDTAPRTSQVCAWKDLWEGREEITKQGSRAGFTKEQRNGWCIVGCKCA